MEYIYSMETKEKLTPEEKWERATLANNFLFYKVMHNNPEICRRLLEILLGMDIERIETHSEDEIMVDYGSKCIRLDVYARNSSRAFDIEMQAVDTKELPERARYYQSVIDVDTLGAGQKYSELKESYIIFICIGDVFSRGLPVYTFENLCRQDNTLPLGDRTHKYFFIARNCDKLLDGEQRSFLKFILTNESSSGFTDRIAKLADDAKKNTQWRMQYMEWERQRTYDYEAGLEAGFENGEHRKAVENALVLVNDFGVNPRIAAEKMGAPLEDVLFELEKDNSSPK